MDLPHTKGMYLQFFCFWSWIGSSEIIWVHPYNAEVHIKDKFFHRLQRSEEVPSEIFAHLQNEYPTIWSFALYV